MKIVAASVLSESQSFAATFTLNLPELFDFYGVAIQLNYSAANSIAGSLAMEVTCSDAQDPNTVWVAYSGFPAITSFTAPTLWFKDNVIFPFKRARLVFTRTSGTGTARILLNGCRV